MIPRHKVKIIQDVDLRKLNLPPIFVINAEDENEEPIELCCNHQYMYSGGMSWDLFYLVYQEEKRVIEKANEQSTDWGEFDEFVSKLGEEGTDPKMRSLYDRIHFEPGIASLSVALSAFGCYPVNGCRAHPRSGTRMNQVHPSVAFWSDKQRGKTLRELAKQLNVGIVLNLEDLEGYPGLVIYGQTIPDLMDYGLALFKKYGVTVVNPRSVKRRQAIIDW